MLKEHDWVGNVRELENTLMNAVLLAKSNVLEKEYFSFLKTSTPGNSSNKLKTIAEVEKAHIEKVLEELNWNKSRTARILGITKTTLYNKIALYNIKTPKR